MAWHCHRRHDAIMSYSFLWLLPAQLALQLLHLAVGHGRHALFDKAVFALLGNSSNWRDKDHHVSVWSVGFAFVVVLCATRSLVAAALVAASPLRIVVKASDR